MERHHIRFVQALAGVAIALISFTEPGWAAPGQKVLYAFQGGTDGAYSQSGLIFDSSGNLYGTTTGGGTAGDGTVFELAPTSNGWNETVLYSFQGGVDGRDSDSSLVVDEAGNLYGTTSLGGTGGCVNGCGTVFELTPPVVNGGPWTESIIYSFQGGADGVGPNGAVVLDKLGNLFGTTQEGGSLECPDDEGVGCGTVFELSPLSGIWTKTTLYSFQGGKQDGALPDSGLTIDNAGSLYGTTYSGGIKNRGTVYEVNSSNGNWSEKVLYSFVTFTSGRNPASTLAFNSSGDLLGTAQGGPSGYGVVFALTPSSGGGWSENVIFQFNSKDGGPLSPGAAFAFDPSGKFYGTSQSSGQNASGAAYRLKPRPQGGATEVLYSFCLQSGCPHGSDPVGGLILDSAGNLYGTTFDGGVGYGVVYEITP